MMCAIGFSKNEIRGTPASSSRGGSVRMNKDWTETHVLQKECCDSAAGTTDQSEGDNMGRGRRGRRGYENVGAKTS